MATFDDLVGLGFTVTPAFFYDDLTVPTVMLVEGLERRLYISVADQETLDAVAVSAESGP